MADLRDSGSIEQDADAIIFVHREAYYLERTTGPTPEKEAARIDRLIDVKDQLEAIIAKQRNGPTGLNPLLFFPSRVGFEEIDWVKNGGGAD